MPGGSEDLRCDGCVRCLVGVALEKLSAGKISHSPCPGLQHCRIQLADGCLAALHLCRV